MSRRVGRLGASSIVALVAMSGGGVAHAQSSGQPSGTPATGAISGAEDQQSPSTSPGSTSVDQRRAEVVPVVGGLGDIVVTARKRAVGETLQAVPLSASAVSGDQLQAANAANLTDISKFSPGVSFQSSANKSVSNFSIRGVGTSGTSPSDEPTVGTFQDGIYWGSQFGGLGELFDLESVQVLRGPQGTLFGRNVTGGAVVITSARPTFTTTGSIGAVVGNGNTYGGSAIISGPIAGDVVAARLAGTIRTTQGLYKYETGGRFGRDTVKLIRPSLLIKPTSDLELLIRGEYFEETGEGTPVKGYSPQVGLPNPVVTQAQQEGFRTTEDFYSIYLGDRGRTDVKTYLASAELNWNVGPGVLTWVNGYRAVNARFRMDVDGFPTQSFNTSQIFKQRQVSSELRYAAEIGKVLSFTSGLFFFQQKFDFFDTRTLDKGTVNLGQNGKLLKNNDYAAFAEADLKIIDGLTVTLGGRYTKGFKEAQAAPYGACTPFTYAVCSFGPVRTYKDSHFTPKAAISYQATTDSLVYGSYTRGVRSGGFSLRGTALASPYASEKVTAWEVGSKNDFFDNRLRVNLAGYIYDYTDIQRVVVATDPVLGIVQSVFNAAGATIKGVDVNVAIQLTPELRLDGSYGYVRARYRSFLGLPNPRELRFVRVPASTAAIGVTYSTTLGTSGKLDFRLSADYTNSYFFDDINQLREPDRWLTDGNIQYTLPNGKTSVSIYARNIFNKEYSVWGSNLGIRGQNSFLGSPRSFGVKASQSF